MLYAGLLNFWNDFGCMSFQKVSSVPRADSLLLVLLRYLYSHKISGHPKE